MIEENVVAEAGTVHYLTLDEIRAAIEELGFQPRQRNVFYELLDSDHERRAIEANRTRFQEIHTAQRQGASRGTAQSNGTSPNGNATHQLPVVPVSIVTGDGTA